jgi:hypothetical protein
MGAAYIPSGTSPSPTGTASAQAGTDEFDVEEKGVVRVLGVVQRRSGLTRLQVKFRSPDFDFSAADRALIAGAVGEATDRRRPTTLGTYYRWVHTELTKNDPGRNLKHIHNVVVDGAFGDATPCTAFGNRDLVAELSYEREGQTPAPTGRPEPTPPDSLESGTALNLVVQQALAHGTRPAEPSGNEKVMHFIKMSSTGSSADTVKAWQALHTRALEANPAFGAGLQGYEVLQRLPNTAARQTTRCAGEVLVPELVACFWSKKTDGGVACQDYVRAFRRADKEKVLDNAASFFLVVQEYQYTSAEPRAPR